MTPTTRYASSSGLHIAYQVVSEGTPDVVLVDGLVSHCDLDWEVPLFHAMRQRLAGMGRFVVFDKRGTGCSDRDLGLGAPEDRMDDIRAVMDAVGMERATIVGCSEGGPLSILFAATYPERVDRLVLYATYARSAHAPDYPWGATAEAHERALATIDKHWGDGLVMSHLAGLQDDPSQRELLARYERATASPRVARRIAEMNRLIDVRPILPTIAVPTLVVHHPGDHVNPFGHAQYMAVHIPGAELHEAPAGATSHVSGDADTWDAIHAFVTGRQRPEETDRVLATVLFTDIVASTERAAALGDARWAELLDAHDQLVQASVARHRGRVVKTTGDGVLATFDGPARAVRCAQALTAEVRSLGLEIRAGLHTGECIVRGDDLAGLGVHIAARVSALAGAGEVLVTSTLRDLVIGSDLTLQEHSSAALKGVPGRWQLLAAR